MCQYDSKYVICGPVSVYIYIWMSVNTSKFTVNEYIHIYKNISDKNNTQPENIVGEEGIRNMHFNLNSKLQNLHLKIDVN